MNAPWTLYSAIIFTYALILYRFLANAGTATTLSCLKGGRTEMQSLVFETESYVELVLNEVAGQLKIVRFMANSAIFNKKTLWF